MVDVILGLQWGDEGKGKIVDYFAKNYDLVARFQGGPNAGHTLYVQGKKIVLHQIPSGIFHQNIENIIGSGVVLDPVTLKKECKAVEDLGFDFRKNLFVSERTHLILPGHRALDKASELAKGMDKIGSTLKGIGPAYMDKTGRNGLRVGDLLRPDFRRKYDDLKSKHQRLLDGLQFAEDISAWESDFFESLELLLSLKIVSGEYFIHDRLQQGKRVLAEGAQGSMLDVDFGTFPFVTSSNTVTAGVCTGLGISPQKIREVIGITKAYCTRVGSGPFPTELNDESGEYLRNKGNEFGSTTGRPRRCGWIDLVALRYACMLNGVNSIVMTKADILDELDELKVCHAYHIGGTETDRIPFQMADIELEPLYRSFKGWKKDISGISHFGDMPDEMRTYIAFLGDFIHAPVKYISNGPGREQIVSV
jgi:adenylosuccinate synthase